jgi:hypothetical protein
MSSTSHQSPGVPESIAAIRTFIAAFILITMLVLLIPTKAAAAPVKWYRADPASGFGSSINVGARCMVEYDGAFYMATYSAIATALCEVWRFDGVASWSKVSESGMGRANNSGGRCMAVYDGNLYLGTDNRVDGGEVWKYDGTAWQCVADGGFGQNQRVDTMTVYNGSLYVGTAGNTANGCEVWAYNGSTWKKVASGGFGDKDNNSALCSAVFKSRLLVGTNNDTSGAEVWAYNGSGWSRIAANGFGKINNPAVWEMAVYNGRLYSSTQNVNQGCEIWSYNGTTWSPVMTGGFGNILNNSALAMGVCNNRLYVGTEQWGLSGGTEVYTYNGSAWNQVNTDGFGNAANWGSWSMGVFEDNIYVGTLNNFTGTEIWTTKVLDKRPVIVPSEKTAGYKEWFLAEGSTGSDPARGSFETWVLLENAGDNQAEAQITYLTPEGTVDGPAVSLEPGTRQTFNVADTVQDNWSVSTQVTSDEPIVAERAMYWNAANGTYRQAAHDSIGVTSPSRTWFLAEGSTGFDPARGGFETWVLLANPGDERADAMITYLTPEGTVPGPGVTLEPGTRQTFNVADTVKDNWSVSTQVTSNEPIVAERAMYWNAADGTYRRAAHDSIGLTNPSGNWFLAEGSTGSDPAKGGFETWVLLANPGTEKADAQITYLTPEGTVAGPDVDLEPGTRRTFNVADTVKDNWSVSTQVTSDRPILAERAMYWNSAAGVYRQAAHDSIGVTSAGRSWFLAEGSTGSDPAKGGFETWVLLANPGTEKANVQITYLTPEGSVDGPAVSLDPGTRQTFNVADTVQDNWSVSTQVTSNQPIIAERAMYWNSAAGVYRQAAHDSIGLDP